jgi:hypothetical protein
VNRTDEQVLEQIRANDPEVRQGQVWRLAHGYQHVKAYPREVRVICRYPFNPEEDGRLWVLENTGMLTSIQRLTERMLRTAYELYEDVEA